jgi:two-component system sensor histidine kinase/response regulator
MEGTPRLLIIDDEEVVLDSCTQILKGGDYQVSTASDGEAGLALVDSLQPDLVFVDLKMPGVSGVEVLHKIHESHPAIVTIVITGYATVSSAVEAMKEGAYDFLPKPFTPDEFRLITQRGLEKRRLVLETMALRREKELLKEHFAAIVSHELKAPLGAVQQNLFVLAQELAGGLNEGQQSRLDRMKASIDALLKLIHTWLRVYSTDIEKIADSFKPTPIRTVIAKAVESVQPHATRKDVEMVALIEEPSPLVQADEGTLVEAAVNLLGNAIKFSRGGSQVRVTAESRDAEVVLTVADSGVGIAAEDLPYLFEGFFVGKSRGGAEKGSGLGLTITKRIVEAHRGSISVQSELGKGCTFVIRLPALATDPRTQPKPDADPVAES